jgi:two-component system, LytTR family, response regulator
MNPAILTCIVVDDEQYAINVLEHFIKETAALKLLKTFTSSPDALTWCMDNPVDLVFLDINMPKLTGIEFAKQLKDRSMVILCSAHSEYGVESYNHSVIDYMLKPVEYSRFLQSIQKAKERISGKTVTAPLPGMDFILLAADSRNRMIKVNHSEIYYLSASKNYLNVHLRDPVIKTLMPLKEAESKLPGNKFIRVHNSYLVAIDKIKFLDNYNITLHHCAEAIPISATYREAVLELLNNAG